jgi:hypothetical protein
MATYGCAGRCGNIVPYPLSLAVLTLMLQPHAVTQDDYYMVRLANVVNKIALTVGLVGLLDPQRRRSDQQCLHNLIQPRTLPRSSPL